MKKPVICALLAAAGLLPLAMTARAGLTITAATTNLPLGASTSVEIYLHPGAGAVSALGATLRYTPGDLAVDFAGINQQLLGGPSQAVHRVDLRAGKVTAGAARPGGTGILPAGTDWFMLLRVRRLGTNTVTLVVDDAFSALGVPPVFEDVPLSNVVFGVIGPDSDGDGIDDVWELTFFPDLTTVGIGTDFDGDGTDDLQEFHAGTNPRIAFLTDDPELTGFASAPLLRLSFRFPTEQNVSYRLQYSTDVKSPAWIDGLFSLTGLGSADQSELVGSGADSTIYVDLPPLPVVFYRVVVREN